MPCLTGSLTKLFASGKKLSDRKSCLEQEGVGRESHFYESVPAENLFNKFLLGKGSTATLKIVFGQHDAQHGFSVDYFAVFN